MSKISTSGPSDRFARPMRRLPGTVVALGFVSLLTDASSEMIYPLLPAFLVSLGASGLFIGLIEGLAESTASFLKLASGVWSDRLPRKKPLVVFGYGLASLARPLVALATAPWQVLAIRFSDRVGKGIRSSPRDALIAQATPSDRLGLAFGFHRAMDHTGALIGPLLAFGMMVGLGLGVRTVFAVAAIPALVAMAVLILGVRESVRSARNGAEPGSASPQRPRLPRPLLAYLGVLAVFTLGNSSDAFLLLRASDLGVPAVQAPLLWGFLHVVKAVLATPLGALSDRLGRRPTILAGWFLYAACYLGFAMASQPWHIWGLFAVYGGFFAATEGAEKALVADLAPAGARGRAFGAFNFLVGLMSLPASIGFGWLWDACGPATAFGVGAALAGVAALCLILLAPESAPSKKLLTP